MAGERHFAVIAGSGATELKESHILTVTQHIQQAIDWIGTAGPARVNRQMQRRNVRNGLVIQRASHFVRMVMREIRTNHNDGFRAIPQGT